MHCFPIPLHYPQSAPRFSRIPQIGLPLIKARLIQFSSLKHYSYIPQGLSPLPQYMEVLMPAWQVEPIVLTNQVALAKLNPMFEGPTAHCFQCDWNTFKCHLWDQVSQVRSSITSERESLFIFCQLIKLWALPNTCLQLSPSPPWNYLNFSPLRPFMMNSKILGDWGFLFRLTV